jgi:hypothetical protein
LVAQAFIGMKRDRRGKPKAGRGSKNKQKAKPKWMSQLLPQQQTNPPQLKEQATRTEPDDIEMEEEMPSSYNLLVSSISLPGRYKVRNSL